MRRSKVSRRGFALPLVLLLALVASLGVAVILNRSGVSGAAVNQQLKVYQRHHTHAGMKEMVDRWLATTHGSLQEQLESDGQAFIIELPRNRRIRVVITDGQGTLLDDLRGLYGAEASFTGIAVDTVRRAVDTNDPAVAAACFRTAGPAAISVNSAIPEVLEAMATAVLPGRDGQRLAQEYLTRRERALIAQAEIRSIALEANATNEDADALERMFVAVPTVWRVEATAFEGSRVVERSGGLIEIVTDPDGGSTVGVGSRTRFLTWDDLPPL